MMKPSVRICRKWACLMAYELIIFDWDGTLVDSEQHIVSSIAYAAEQSGLPVLDHDRTKQIIGLGMREALQSLYPGIGEEGVESMRRHYAEAFFQQETGEAQLFDGVIDTLESLRSRGYTLAVATGKSRRGLEKALDSTGLRLYFDVTRCADETRSKPHPMMLEQVIGSAGVSVERSLFVGDTEFDLEMARRIEMASIGVSYGVHDVPQLERHQPLRIIDHISELLNVC